MTENKINDYNCEKILYIEPYSGIAGDMFVAALSELIPNLNVLYNGLKSLPIKNDFEINFEDISKNGIKSKRFNVKLLTNSNKHGHGRHLSDIISIINSAGSISEKAKNLAIEVFHNLAIAEAAVHGKEIAQVHFHEVGAIDAIVDITSASILVSELNPGTIISAPISVGQGTIKCAHGILPVPCPATVEIIKGYPVNYTAVNSELTTPTGAAILTTITNKWNTPHSGTLIKSGYGAGTKDIEDIANILRVSLLKTEQFNSNEEITVIECNVDDYPGEHLSFLGPKLLADGALDFAVIPITMKKGRQGMLIQVLCPIDIVKKITKILLTETTTLGIRYRNEKRIILDRKFELIDTPLGKIKVKLAILNGKILKAKPEQAEIENISKSSGITYYETDRLLNYCIQQWIMKNEQ